MLGAKAAQLHDPGRRGGQVGDPHIVVAVDQDPGEGALTADFGNMWGHADAAIPVGRQYHRIPSRWHPGFLLAGVWQTFRGGPYTSRSGHIRRHSPTYRDKPP